ncbi:MAG: hypothetical protein R3D86_13025 [Emcibacteraceae bacterium]
MNITYHESGEDSARRHMIDGQLLPNEVTDENVVDAIEKVKREALCRKSEKVLPISIKA